LKELCLVDVGLILSKDRDTDFLLSPRFLAKLCGCASIGLMMMMMVMVMVMVMVLLLLLLLMMMMMMIR